MTAIADRLPVTAHAIVQRRRGVAGWAVGTALLVAALVAIFPAVRDAPGFADLMKHYPKEILRFFGAADASLTTPRGYLQIEVFSFMVPLAFLIVGIASGANAVGGEEEQGTLGLVLSQPVPRRRVVFEKALALVYPVGVLGIVTLAVLLLAGPIVGLHVPFEDLTAATLDVVMLGLLFGSLALLLGAAGATRGVAVAVSTSFAVATYLVDSLANLVDWLRAGRRISPFSQTLGRDPLHRGFHPWHTLGLGASIVVIVAIAAWAFDRRDLRC